MDDEKKSGPDTSGKPASGAITDRAESRKPNEFSMSDKERTYKARGAIAIKDHRDKVMAEVTTENNFLSFSQRAKKNPPSPVNSQFQVDTKPKTDTRSLLGHKSAPLSSEQMGDVRGQFAKRSSTTRKPGAATPLVEKFDRRSTAQQGGLRRFDADERAADNSRLANDAVPGVTSSAPAASAGAADAGPKVGNGASSDGGSTT